MTEFAEDAMEKAYMEIAGQPIGDELKKKSKNKGGNKGGRPAAAIPNSLKQKLDAEFEDEVFDDIFCEELISSVRSLQMDLNSRRGRMRGFGPRSTVTPMLSMLLQNRISS